MILTNRQKKDLETIRYFIPREMRNIVIVDEDIKRFLELSERGRGENSGKFAKGGGYEALVQGKRLCGLHMGMWEEGILEGSVPYFTLLGGFEKIRKWYNILRYFKGKYTHDPLPRAVVDFMKKEMFKGFDAVIIKEIYQKIL